MTEELGSQVRPVILCGGGGTRLWPLSRAALPKQFLSLIDEDSLLQMTVKRCQGHPFLPPLIVAGEEQRVMVLDQMEAVGIDSAAVLLEPVARNTAPAIALAALWSLDEGDELILVMPSDHVIEDVAALREAVLTATPAASAGAIVTFGIEPTSANSGYGYIRTSPGNPGQAVREIAEFIEKPDRSRAAALLAEGDCYWNSGIFLMQPSLFIDQLHHHAPAIAVAATNAMKTAKKDGPFLRPNSAAFTEAPSISIDYAVMERTSCARVIPVDCGWSDVGSWDAVWGMLPHDDGGNVLRGDVVTSDVTNSLIRCDSGQTVVAVGLSNMVCVITADAAFIAPLDRAQENKAMVELLRENGNARADDVPQARRAWSATNTIAEDDAFRTRRLILQPGEKQAAQLHEQSAVHWVVVSGTAEITIGTEVRLVKTGASALVPAGAAHRLANPGSNPLQVVEVVCGAVV